MKISIDRILIFFLSAVLLQALGCSSEPEVQQFTTGVPDTADAVPAVSEQHVENGILFFGNSITAGYGVENDRAFPQVIERKIDSLNWSFEVVQAGVSGETTSAGRRRIGHIMQEGVDVVVVELGGNDGLRGVEPDVTRRNLAALIDTARRINPDVRVLLGGMQVPPNLGASYTKAFREIYPELAAEKQVELIPFILQGVGGIDEFNQPDGIHPNARGHRKIARTVWNYLKPVLQEIRVREDMASEDVQSPS